MSFFDTEEAHAGMPDKVHPVEFPRVRGTPFGVFYRVKMKPRYSGLDQRERAGSKRLPSLPC